MESSNNFPLKVEVNNNPPIPAGGPFTLSNDNVSYPNLSKNDDQNKGVSITVQNNNEINENISYNKNRNDPYIKPSNELNNIESPNKVDSRVESLNISFHINYDIESKFLMKVYGIVLFQFIIIFGLTLIFQIESIKNYIQGHESFFWAFFAISLFIIIFPVILFECCPRTLQSVPYNYIILFAYTIFLAIFCAFLGSFYHFQAVLGVITCIVAICIGSFCIGLFNKGGDAKAWFFIISSLICLALHYGIMALIFRSYYYIFLYDTIFAIIYALYIAFDTINIKQNLSCDDYIAAAIILDIDIIRLFIILLRIFGSKKD